jgi:hypothetical protein
MRSRTGHLWMALLLGAGIYLALPGFAAAAEGEGGRSELWLGIGKLANLILVIAVLVWVARKPLANFFAVRTQTIRLPKRRRRERKPKPGSRKSKLP